MLNCRMKQTSSNLRQHWTKGNASCVVGKNVPLKEQENIMLSAGRLLPKGRMAGIQPSILMLSCSNFLSMLLVPPLLRWFEGRGETAWHASSPKRKSHI